jgi:hypothetical protein
VVPFRAATTQSQATSLHSRSDTPYGGAAVA